MSNLPYDPNYLKYIFSNNPMLQKNTHQIIEKLGGNRKNSLILTKEGLEELIENILLTFINSEGIIPKVSELTSEQHSIFFKQIIEISKLISEHSTIEDDKTLLSLVVDNLANSYFDLLQQNYENEPDFLTEKDKKKIKEELQRMMEYEIHKKMNPKRIAGETSKDNFFNNMQVGGEALARSYEGKEYLVKIDNSQLGQLEDDHKKFRQDFNVEKTSAGQKLTHNVSSINRYQKGNFGKE